MEYGPFIYTIIFYLMLCINSSSNSNSKQYILCHDFTKKYVLQCLVLIIPCKQILCSKPAKALGGLEQKFACSVYSEKFMCGKLTSTVKPFISQDHFSVEVLYYLVERNTMKYNVSEVSESFRLCESKKEEKIIYIQIYIYIYIYIYIIYIYIYIRSTWARVKNIFSKEK